jgi:endonuclease YncB( thermonuclease family)
MESATDHALFFWQTAMRMRLQGIDAPERGQERQDKLGLTTNCQQSTGYSSMPNAALPVK